MIENLFSSKVLFQVLATLFENADRPLSTPEIIRATGKNQANVLRELEKLVAWKLVSKAKRGNQNVYQLDANSPSFVPLRSLFSGYGETVRKFFLFTEEGGAALLSQNFFTRGFSSDYAVKKGVVSAATDVISHYKGGYGWFYFEKGPFMRCAEESLVKLLADPSFVMEVIFKESVDLGRQALDIYRARRKAGFCMGRREASELVHEFETIITRQVSLNYIAVFDLKDQIYSKYLERYLAEKIGGSGLKLKSAIEKLMTPEQLTYTQLLRIELLRLAIARRQGRKNWPAGLEAIWQEWKWLNFGYRGPALGADFFQQSFDELLSKGLDGLRGELRTALNHARRTRQEKEKLYAKLGIDKKHRDFIDALSLLSYLKVYRKDTAFLLFFMTYEILGKFSKGMRREDLLYLTLNEAYELIGGKLTASRQELIRRQRDCVHLAKADGFLYGREADAYVDKMVEKEEVKTLAGQISQLEGTTACLGRTGDWVHGCVKIINVPEDMKKMGEGDVLVSIATTPDILPAMKKAAAIVTEHGGITCHAAIVSRELNVPCLIAVKYATKMFKDGDSVTVCPRHGYIKLD